jgi:alpha-amylase/alpha-mannosidase (GH57 family)
MSPKKPPPEKSVCIHGHFYQPPREDPWTGAIAPQPSAAPFHDWNARVAAECYGPNAAARILDEAGKLVAERNNFERISFDFGPTLLSWMQANAPDIYGAVLAADRVAHGALAQAYSHMILPLANARDRQTQVHWGSQDFRSRFGREPEGMWLPETAVDMAALDALAAAGIRFTILAPRQARRVRAFGGHRWQDVTGAKIDTRHVYEVRLPSERRIAVFFYDAGLAQAVAFEGLLRDGHRLAERLANGFDESGDEIQLVSVATDGESYGHHHKFGEMALASALRFLEARGDIHITNYRAFLATHPPAHEVEIIENSSWSCEHGIERWRSDCGCNSGGAPNANQGWRAPMRDSLNWLRDQIAPAYAEAAERLVRDAWAARNDYIDVLLDGSPASLAAFLNRHQLHPLDVADADRVWRLLELQRFAMLMFTSCGWFFDEITGIEATQNLAYAQRAMELAQETLGLSVSAEFARRLG